MFKYLKNGVNELKHANRPVMSLFTRHTHTHTHTHTHAHTHTLSALNTWNSWRCVSPLTVVQVAAVAGVAPQLQLARFVEGTARHLHRQRFGELKGSQRF